MGSPRIAGALWATRATPSPMILPLTPMMAMPVTRGALRPGSWGGRAAPPHGGQASRRGRSLAGRHDATRQGSR